MADLARLERRIADTQARLCDPPGKGIRGRPAEQQARQRYLDGLRDALADARDGEATGLPIEVTAHPHVWAILLRLATSGATRQDEAIRRAVTAHRVRRSEAAAWKADTDNALTQLGDTIRTACAAQPQRRQWFPEDLFDSPAENRHTDEA